MSKNTTIGVVAAIVLAPLGLIFSILLLAAPAEADCTPDSLTVDGQTVPDTEIAGYGHDQLVNAATIIEAGKALGLGARDQTIGVMTAMGESALRVIDYGDAAGPDSRGLFQQRDNGAWGSYEDRMDPYTSATNFFTAMMRIEGRDDLAPTIVAHRTQINADPYHYESYWAGAVEIVEALAGLDTGLNMSTGTCETGELTDGAVSDTGWAAPGAGPVTSAYGMRTDPVSGFYTRLHAGTDLQAGGCDGPIWAAQSGTITFAGMDSGGTGTIVIDHGGGVQTAYLHMYASGILSREGDTVTAGQQIARVGNTGNSTGCHLHFEVRLNGTTTDPEPYMADHGVTLG